MKKSKTNLTVQLIGVAALIAVIVLIVVLISSIRVPSKAEGNSDVVEIEEWIDLDDLDEEDVAEDDDLIVEEVTEDDGLLDLPEEEEEEEESDPALEEEITEEEDLNDDEIFEDDGFDLAIDSVLDDYEEYDPELVREIQSALRRHGYDVKIDGVFGPKTGMAVKRFQRAEGLTIDGIVGKRTLKALGIESATDVYPRYAPNLRAAFERSDSGRAIHLNLGSHKVEAWVKKEDGWHLRRVMLAATGNQKKGYFTDLCNTKLKKTPTPGGRISDDNWRGNYATPISNGDYFHTVLQHKRHGEWIYDDESCLGKNVSHGCVRLAVEDAKWLQSFAKKGTVIVVDDRAWDLAPEED